MKVFQVYEHKVKSNVAVKIGFSWPGLFFGGAWMVIKGFPFRGIFFVIVDFALLFHNLILGGNRYTELMTPIVGERVFLAGVLLYLLSIFFILLPGFKGNTWLRKKYPKNGYVLIKSVSAESKQAAIALVKNEENIKSQDSFQETYYSEAYKEIENYENEINKNEKMQYIKNSSLWARAFAESEGEETKQKAIYVKLRTNQLSIEDLKNKELTNAADEKDKEQRELSKKKSVGSKIFFYGLLVTLILLIIYL